MTKFTIPPKCKDCGQILEEERLSCKMGISNQRPTVAIFIKYEHLPSFFEECPHAALTTKYYYLTPAQAFKAWDRLRQEGNRKTKKRKKGVRIHDSK